MTGRLLRIVGEVLSLPTAPFREQAVREYILDFCRQRGIKTAVDAIGNILARYGRSQSNSMVFMAHMDHPGFIIEKNSVRNKTTAVFHGGVEKEYFRRNTAIRVFTGDGPVAGKMVKVQFDRKKREKRAWIAVERPVMKGDLAMWDLPACRIQGDRLFSRACDDIVGCASILALLDVLYQRKIKRNVTALFTVAEEAGLHGAKFAAMKAFIPENSIVISIETSSVLPTVSIGNGVVVRVGDRNSIFQPAITKWMLNVSKAVQEKDKKFQYQRKLMDAGTCEASIFSAFGYTAGAVCIPLGNYHNRDVKHRKIAAEYVSCRDLENMIKLFLALVEAGVPRVKLMTKPPKYKRRSGKLGEIFWQ